MTGDGTTAKPALIPSFTVDLSHLPPDEQFAAWQERCDPLYDVRPVAQTAGAPIRPMTAWTIGELALYQSVIPPGIYSLSRPRVALQDEGLLTVRLYRASDQLLLYRDECIQLRSGEIHIFDFPHASQELYAPKSMLSLYVPYAAIGYDPSRHPRHIVFPAGSPIGRVIENAMLAVQDEANRLTLGDAEAVANGLLGMLRGALRLEQADAASRHEFGKAQARAMKDWLEQNLHDPDLGLASLQRVFGASRSTVYRLFADEGGLVSYIRQRRLERAYRDLAAADPSARTIHAIGQRWCFDEPSDFSRSFRRAFSLSPSDVVGLALPLPGAETADPVHSPFVRSWIGG